MFEPPIFGILGAMQAPGKAADGAVRDRVMERLRAAGIAFRVIEHEPAVGSLNVARARGMPPSAGAKSLVVRAAGVFLLIVIPGDRRLSSPKLRRALATHDIRFATAAELLARTGCRPGGVPPLGDLFGLEVVMDSRLAAPPELAFTAGSAAESFVVASGDLIRLTAPRLADLTRGGDA